MFAIGLGLYAVTLLGALFLLFVAAGGALVLRYAFEAPVVHSDIGFALGWGSLIAAPEGALRVLWLAILAVALSGLAARWL